MARLFCALLSGLTGLFIATPASPAEDRPHLQASAAAKPGGAGRRRREDHPRPPPGPPDRDQPAATGKARPLRRAGRSALNPPPLPRQPAQPALCGLSRIPPLKLQNSEAFYTPNMTLAMQNQRERPEIAGFRAIG